MSNLYGRLDDIAELLRRQWNLLAPEAADHGIFYLLHRDVGGIRAPHHDDPGKCWCEPHIIACHELRDVLQLAANIVAIEHRLN